MLMTKEEINMACTAVLGVGYIISAEDAEVLRNNENWEEYVMSLNYYDDGSDCFVGEILSICGPGEVTKAFIPSSVCAYTDKVEEKFGKVIPDKYEANIYVLSAWD